MTGSIFPYTYTTGDPKFFIGVHAALFIKPARRLAANTARWQYLLSGKGQGSLSTAPMFPVLYAAMVE